MLVTIAFINGDILSLNVSEDIDLASFKANLGAEINESPENISLYYNEKELTDPFKPLNDYGIKDNDLLAANISKFSNQASQQSQNASNSSQQAMSSIEQLRQKILAEPSFKSQLSQVQPDLVTAASVGSKEFAEAYMKYENKKNRLEREREAEMARLEADPFNMEAQQKIENIIREQNILNNMKDAMEHNPESFGQVHMLYIKTELNGFPVKAFVDSGAQSTIINPTCAEACGLMRLMDTRFAGIARGVGTAKILGRVHSAPIKIGNGYYPCSFLVMEGKDVDLLFGLDMLKRYQASIDLKADALVISGEHIPFLPEHEIPKHLMSSSESDLLEQQVSGSNTVVPQPPQQAPQGQASNFPEKSISDLMELGKITRQHAIALLEQTSGDLDLAANILLG